MFRGPLLFAPRDNLNADGIYPGKYTYQDDITLEKQAEVVTENCDPSFAALVASIRSNRGSCPTDPDTKEGIILVSGYKFGTGSSREQTGTTLKAAGIPLTIAGSFRDIFKRNTINNGLVCIESPEIVKDLTKACARCRRERREVDGQQGPQRERECGGGHRESEISERRDQDVLGRNRRLREAGCCYETCMSGKSWRWWSECCGNAAPNHRGSEYRTLENRSNPSIKLMRLARNSAL